ncbi:MAG: Gfo/Idh/MocA family oxidoreductase [Planctomycetes bacterium]|nr:Gfo/Idh/MocA family oxidoreductase [Planctomycetota bacterium]
MKVTVGVIGCGNISRFHFSGLEKAGARIKWVCDLSEAAARPWAEKFGASYTDDYRRILADPEVNAVDVTALSSVHKEICLAAIAAGKAVICEKTLAENPEDACAIVQAAASAGTVFHTSYMKRYIPAMVKAKELMPLLGRIITTHIRAHQCWGELWSAMPEQGFFHTPPGGSSQVRRSYGGGILICGGSHILDLVGYFLGRPERIYACAHTPDDGRDYDLLAAAIMETANGVCHYEALAHPLTRIGFLRDGWDERVEITGVGGRLDVYSSQWDNPCNKASLLVHYDESGGTSTEYRFPAVSPFDEAIGHFCADSASGIQSAQPRTTGYDVDELIAAITHSARKRQAVAMHYRLSAD